MDQILTLKRAKIGPVFNFTAYVCIHIYIYMSAEALWGLWQEFLVRAPDGDRFILVIISPGVVGTFEQQPSPLDFGTRLSTSPVSSLVVSPQTSRTLYHRGQND